MLANELKDRLIICDVRRVKIEDVKRQAPCLRRPLQKIERIGCNHSRSVVCYFQSFTVRFDERTHFSRLIDERHVTGTARNCFNANSARPSAEIKQARATDLQRKNIEKSFPQTIGCRPRPGRRRTLQFSAAIFSGNDAQFSAFTSSYFSVRCWQREYNAPP
jgi:hypothetical protein